MSAVIKNALSHLNGSLDRLESAVQESAKRAQEQQKDLFAAQAALNDNALTNNDLGGINSSNAEEFAKRLDDAINKVESLLREG